MFFNAVSHFDQCQLLLDVLINNLMRLDYKGYPYAFMPRHLGVLMFNVDESACTAGLRIWFYITKNIYFVFIKLSKFQFLTTTLLEPYVFLAAFQSDFNLLHSFSSY